VVHEPIEIGRDCSGLLLTDPQISRLHLTVQSRLGRVTVTDVGSTNGSSLDGTPFVGAVDLPIGSTVRFGATTIEIVSGAVRAPMAGSARMGAATDLRRTSIDIVADAVADSPVDLRPVSTDQGTLTIVFSDIESSTMHAERLGDEKWFALLSVHNDLFRRRVSEFGGTEIKAQGDGFMLAFPSGRSAVLCMIEVQRDLAKHTSSHPDQEIRVRVGLHTGEVIADSDGDLFGKHVILAARVGNEAEGGEILVSALLREIVESRGDIEFGEPRSVDLKGLAGEYTVFPVIW